MIFDTPPSPYSGGDKAFENGMDYLSFRKKEKTWLSGEKERKEEYGGWREEKEREREMEAVEKRGP